MVYDKILTGNDISLRALKLDDCNDNYVNWLNDPLINKYLQTRWEQQDISTIRNYVNSISDSDHSYIFAIIDNSTNKHVGNIKIGPINFRNNNAEISYLIGERSVWGKGYASQAIKLITDFGFGVLKLHKIQATVISGNDSSEKVLLKNGFLKEGELRDMYIIDDEYKNAYVYGLIKS